MSNTFYFYIIQQTKCVFESNDALTFNVTKYYNLPGEDNMAMSLAFSGPISVGIDASEDLSLYCHGKLYMICLKDPHIGLKRAVHIEVNKNNFFVNLERLDPLPILYYF